MVEIWNNYLHIQKYVIVEEFTEKIFQKEKNNNA